MSWKCYVRSKLFFGVYDCNHAECKGIKKCLDDEKKLIGYRSYAEFEGSITWKEFEAAEQIYRRMDTLKRQAIFKGQFDE
jgi:hypothetical protein